jgi:hypothetical protein
MAKSPMRALVTRSLQLPGAVLDAVLRRGGGRAAPLPVLERLRAFVARVGADPQVPRPPLAATYSEVRVYGAPLGRFARAVEVAPSAGDGLDGALGDLKAQLRPIIGQLRVTARDVALAVAARLDRDLAGIEAAVTRLELPRGTRRRRAVVTAVEQALGEARRLEAQVRPARGRRRDLRRIAAVARQLATATRAAAARKRR